MSALDECSWWVFMLVLKRANFLSICFLLLFLDREMLPCSERLTFRHHWSHFSRHRLICRQFPISELPFISVSKSLRKAHAFIPTLHVNKTNFRIKGSTQALALKQRRKAIENWAIPLPDLINATEKCVSTKLIKSARSPANLRTGAWTTKRKESKMSRFPLPALEALSMSGALRKYVMRMFVGIFNSKKYHDIR